MIWGYTVVQTSETDHDEIDEAGIRGGNGVGDARIRGGSGGGGLAYVGADSGSEHDQSGEESADGVGRGVGEEHQVGGAARVAELREPGGGRGAGDRGDEQRGEIRPEGDGGRGDRRDL